MTQTTPQPIALTARNSLDLVALAPSLLGFHPESSVVMLTFRDPGSGRASRTSRSSSLTARVDLPLDAEGWGEVAGLMVRASTRHQVAAAAVLIYSEDHEVARGQAEVLTTALEDAGIRVIDALRVDDDRWYAALDDDAEGTAYDLSTHPFTVRQVFEGRQIQANRAALADSLIGGDTSVLDRVAAFAAQVERPLGHARRLEEARWVLQVLDGPPPSEAEVARLLCAITDFRLRDVAWLAMDRSSAQGHVDFWRDVVRRSPTALLPDAAALLGFAAWLAGQGALAWCAVDRCCEVDPDHGLGGLVARALTGAMSPEVWPAARLGPGVPPEQAGQAEQVLVDTARGRPSSPGPGRG